MIYLDNAATTKLHPEVLAAMIPFLTEAYGNAGTLYRMGQEAAKAVAAAREQTAGLFGADSPEHIVFTSGGSESNSLVFSGLRKRLAASGKTHLIISSIEHDSVLKAAEALAGDGFCITYVAPDFSGRISSRRIEEAIRPDTGLVSVMYVNNETGAVNGIKDIGDVCRAKGVLFHTDCVQAAGQYPIEVDRNLVDFASVSAHKFHGPKGIGALYVRDPLLLQPMIHGGDSQEFGIRGGTENTPGIAGMGKAAEIAVENMKEDMMEVSSIKQEFYTTLIGALHEKGIGGIVHINGPAVVEMGKILNLRFDGVDAETLLIMADSRGVAVSAGSACNSREAVPSHVLKAMGLTDEEARSSIRVSFSGMNTEDEAVQAGRVIAECVSVLRGEPSQFKSE